MAEESKKGVIVEFDFAVLNGAELLYQTTEALLKENDIPFSTRVEAQHLAGGNYQGGLAEYFTVIKTKKTAAKAAKDLTDRFAAVLNAAVPAAVTPTFRNFVKTLADKGVRVVIATRADVEAVRPAFEGLLGEDVILHQEQSTTYGCVKWDAWRRACSQNDLVNMLAVAVTGSGKGVKSALVAGLSALAVEHDHVAYQDFGGADAVVSGFDAKLADVVFRMLHI